jgi:RNA-directed DNA polymerase
MAEFKDALTLHLRHLENAGPSAHASARNFHSVIGLKHHVEGLIAYAKGVDSVFADKCATRFSKVKWPILTAFDLDDIGV